MGILNLYSLFDHLHFLRYTCFFTPKPRSPCVAFQNDSENFKGSDGVLLCYKTQLFDEIQRYHYQYQEDGTPGRPVSITKFILKSLTL